MIRLALLASLGVLAAGAHAASTAGADKVRTMDADKDGKVSATEHAASARKMFQMIDTDGDGAISPAEFDAAEARVRAAQARKDKDTGT